MPRVGPGDDNITGDRYTLDLGVEPDLGNLLQNLQVANDLLDAAEEKFRAISDVVGSTTQRLTQATRQTQLLAAETSRLQNYYSNIANSSFALSNIGGMASGMPGGMGYFPGQMAFQGMPPVQQQQDVVDTMSQAGSDQGNFDDVMAQEYRSQASSPGGHNLSGSQLAKVGAGYEAIKGRSWYQSLKGGYESGGKIWNPAKTWRGGVAAGQPPFDPTALSEGMAAGEATGAVTAGGEAFTSATEAMAAGFAPEAIAGAEGIGAAGALGGLGAVVGAAAPWAMAAMGAYKLYAGLQGSARRYSGITGGTGMFDGPAGGGAAQLQARSLMMNFLNPGADYGRAQEESMNTGATGGAYNQTRDFLFEASKRGMSDTIDMVHLYEEAVSKAGGTTGQLTGSLDRLRAVARNTNSSLQLMTQNWAASMDQYISMGMSGGAANAGAIINSTAFATNSNIASMNPVLRNSGGYDVTNPYIQSSVTSQLGIGYTQLGIQSALHPQLGTAMPVLTEDAVIRGLTQQGFTKDMVFDDVVKRLGEMGGYPYAGQVLESMGLLPQGVGSQDLRSVAESIMAVFERPASATAKEIGNAGAPIEAGDERNQFYKGDNGNYVSGMTKQADGTYVDASGMKYTDKGNGTLQDSMGNFVHQEGITADALKSQWDFSTGSKSEDVANQYLSSIQNDNMQRSPVVEAALAAEDHGINTLVHNTKDPSTVLFIKDFIAQHPQDFQELLDDPNSGWEITTVSQDQVEGLNKAAEQGGTAKDKAVSALGWSTGDQFAMNQGDSNDPNDVHSAGSAGEFDLGEQTLARLEQIWNKDD